MQEYSQGESLCVMMCHDDGGTVVVVEEEADSALLRVQESSNTERLFLFISAFPPKLFPFF